MVSEAHSAGHGAARDLGTSLGWAMQVSWGILADMLTLWEQKRRERSQFTTLLVVPLQKFTALAITQGFCSAFSPLTPLLWLNCMSNLTQYFYSYTSVAYFSPAQHGSVIHVCEVMLQVLANSLTVEWQQTASDGLRCLPAAVWSDAKLIQLPAYKFGAVSLS